MSAKLKNKQEATDYRHGTKEQDRTSCSDLLDGPGQHPLLLLHLHPQGAHGVGLARAGGAVGEHHTVAAVLTDQLANLGAKVQAGKPLETSRWV